MRQIVIFAGMLLVMGVSAARMADKAGHDQVVPPAAALAVPPQSHNPVGGSVTIPPDRRGQFVVAARVDGHRMNFMVDTGATLVALRWSDAAALGAYRFARDFDVEVKTANGTTHAAKIDLGLVEIENLTVRNVAALISPDNTLSENLLGLSFLKHVRFRYEENQMVLEQ